MPPRALKKQLGSPTEFPPAWIERRGRVDLARVSAKGPPWVFCSDALR